MSVIRNGINTSAGSNAMRDRPARERRGRGRTCRWLSVGLALLATGVLGAPLPAQTAQRVVYVVPIDGVIDLGLAPFVGRVLKEAAGADLPQEKLVQSKATTLTCNAQHGYVGERIRQPRRDFYRRGRRYLCQNEIFPLSDNNHLLCWRASLRRVGSNGGGLESARSSASSASSPS